MDDALFSLLKRIDTPTVCNAIEVAHGKRGFSAFTRQTVLASAPKAPAMVGYARTAQIAALSPPTDPPEVIKARRMAYYRYMSEGPRPAIAVIEDTDYPDCVGAYWGEVNTTIHKGFGLSGAFTNGVMRDLNDLADNFPVIAGAVGPSHAFVHVRTIAEPVSIFGMKVNEGDLIHADCHGGLVIPTDIIPVLQTAIEKLLATEKLVLEPARKDGFDFETFKNAWEEFEKART